MAMNPGFDAGVQAIGAGGKKLLLLCRSGVRAIAAAQRATEAARRRTDRDLTKESKNAKREGRIRR